MGKVLGFLLHAGVWTRADERQKLEWLRRYIPRPVMSEKHLSLTPNDNIGYQLKTPDFISPLGGAGAKTLSQPEALPQRIRP